MTALGWFLVVLGAVALFGAWRIVRMGDDDR
jgi:hypothetical protein